MIAAIIVIVSIVFAAAFTLAYLVKPNLRKQIEQPKYFFHDQVQAYNRQVHDARENVKGDSNGDQ
jgi:hypothetical protein